MVWILTPIALVAAIISGVAGIGGGTILIAAMFAVGLAPVIAVPLHAAVQMVSNLSRTLAYLPAVDRRAAAWFLAGSLPLPFLVAPLVARANPDVIRLMLGGFVLLSLLPWRGSRVSLPMPARMLTAGALNGSVGMVVGATGLVIAPFFLDPRWRKETTVGTLALCQTLGHGIKIAAFATYGFGILGRWDLLLPLCVAVIVGTVIGRWLHDRVSRRLFLQLFHAILAILAARLLWSGATGLWYAPAA